MWTTNDIWEDCSQDAPKGVGIEDFDAKWIDWSGSQERSRHDMGQELS